MLDETRSTAFDKVAQVGLASPSSHSVNILVQQTSGWVLSENLIPLNFWIGTSRKIPISNHLLKHSGAICNRISLICGLSDATIKKYNHKMCGVSWYTHQEDYGLVYSYSVLNISQAYYSLDYIDAAKWGCESSVFPLKYHP